MRADVFERMPCIDELNRHHAQGPFIQVPIKQVPKFRCAVSKKHDM